MLFVRKTVCVIVPSVLWIGAVTCTLTTFDCETLVTFQWKMTIRGHGDRNERLKSTVKSEGKHTHTQSIFSVTLHFKHGVSQALLLISIFVTKLHSKRDSRFHWFEKLLHITWVHR